MIPAKKVNRELAGRAAAVLHLQSHGEDIQIGSRIRYARPTAADSYIEDEFVVQQSDLEIASKHRAGEIEFPPMIRRTASLV